MSPTGQPYPPPSPSVWGVPHQRGQSKKIPLSPEPCREPCKLPKYRRKYTRGGSATLYGRIGMGRRYWRVFSMKKCFKTGNIYICIAKIKVKTGLQEMRG